MNIMNVLFKSRTAKNASWLIAGKIVQMILAFFIGLITARYLGPSNYGLIGYGTTYVTFFSSLCSLGINSVLVKELVDNHEKSGEIIGTTLALKAIASFASVIMIFGIVSIIDKNDSVAIVVTMLCSIGVFFNIFDTLNYWFQSRFQSKYSAIAILVGYLATSIYRIVLLILKKPVQYFALASAVDYLFVGLILILFYIKNKGNKLAFSLQYSKELLGKSWHFILPNIMVAIYSQTDKFMLKQMINETELGYYNAALTICNMWVFVLNAIIDSFYPSIMGLHKEGKESLYIKRNKQLYAIVFYLSIFVATIICLFATIIVRILYGDLYLPAITPLRVVVFYSSFAFLGVARNAWIVAEEKQKYLIWIYVFSTSFNIILNILLIPIYGAVGAAIASLVSQVLSTFVVPFILKPFRKNTKLMVEAILLRDVF